MNIEKTIEQLETGVVEIQKIENWLFTTKEFRNDLKSKTQHAFKNLFEVIYQSNPSQKERIFAALKWYQMPVVEGVLGKAPTCNEYLKYVMQRGVDTEIFEYISLITKQNT